MFYGIKHEGRTTVCFTLCVNKVNHFNVGHKANAYYDFIIYMYSISDIDQQFLYLFKDLLLARFI